MDLGLANKVAFVAGSSRGIGRAIAEAFLGEGCCVVVTGRNREDLEASAADLAERYGRDNVLGIAVDLSDADAAREACRRAVQQWGSIDCAVANVGSGKSVPGWDLTRADWDASFGLNLWPSVTFAREAAACLTASGGGSLVFIASITGVESTAAPLPYSAAKAALINYASNLARVVARENVRVNTVAPGNVLFPGGSWERHLSQRRDEVLRMIQAEVPQNRFGTVQEIADIVVFLSSPRSSYVTGACWTVDGGQTRSI